jgi:hypothetical protein
VPIPKHTVRFLYVELFGIRVKRHDRIARFYLVVFLPSVRRQHFRIFRQTPVVPGDRIPNLKARVLDARKQAVMGSIAREREQVATGLQHAFDLARPFLTPRLVFFRFKIIP